jgi:hypothetical protein
MPSANRISDFISAGSPVESPVAPPGGHPNRLRIVSGDEKPIAPRDLLAQLIAPPADARLRDRRFAAIRRQLIDQFQPTEPALLVDIDLIASDLLHLASLRQAMELMTAPIVSPEVVASVRAAAAPRKILKLLKRLICHGESSKLFDSSDEDAATLAPRLADEFRGLKELVAEADAELAEVAAERAAASPDNPSSTPAEIDPEDLRRRQLLEIVLPIEPVLTDPTQAVEVLTGNRPLQPDERIRWVAILKLAAEGTAIRLFPTNGAVAKAQAAERATLMALAQDPVRLAVLHRSASQIEEAIQVRLKRLKALR